MDQRQLNDANAGGSGSARRGQNRSHPCIHYIEAHEHNAESATITHKLLASRCIGLSINRHRQHRHYKAQRKQSSDKAYWMRGRESDPEHSMTGAICYHYTTPQDRDTVTVYNIDPRKRAPRRGAAKKSNGPH